MADRNLSTIAVQSASGKSFTNQGSISWTDLASKSIGATVGILSRISAAGVDPYTVVVGQKLGSEFRLTQQGRANIVDALQNLKSFQSLSKYLEFGFGISHLVRVLARTEEGIMCLSLCAALIECYDIAVAGEILLEIVKTSRAPEDLQPSGLEWHALLRACSGVLSATDFPLLADKYMSMHPVDRRPVYEPLHGSNLPYRSCSSPESIAKVLLAIAQISSEHLAGITVEGGADIGFLAALCDWFFQIPFQIRHGSTGAVLYTSDRENNGNGQSSPSDRIVTFVFRKMGGTSEDTLDISERIYILADASHIIQREVYPDRHRAAAVVGRVPWSTVLSSQFGPELKALLTVPRAVGGYLGCLCRIARAIASAEDGIPASFKRHCQYYAKGSHGRGLGELMARLFPEIEFANPFLTGAATLSLDNAQSKLESHLVCLRLTCNCPTCQRISLLLRMLTALFCS